MSVKEWDRETGPGGKTTSEETCVGALACFCDKTPTKAP